MNHRFLSIPLVMTAALFLSVAPVAAQNEVTKMLMGEWKGDTDRTKKALMEAGVDEAQITAMLETIPAITVIFGKDDVFTMKLALPTNLESFEGTWKPKSEAPDKNQCVITLEVEAAANDKQELVCTFLEMGQFVHIAAGDEPPIVLKRVKE